MGLDPNAGTADDRLALRGALAGGWLGFTLGERFPLHFRVGAGALLGAILDDLEQPRWSATHVVQAGSDGFGTFEGEALTGAILVALAPGFGARYDF